MAVLAQAFPAAPSLGAIVALALITEVFFGNTSHIGLTLLLLSSNRAMRAAPPEGLRRLLAVAAAIFVASMALFAALHRLDPVNAFGIVFPIVLALSFHHNLSQARGFWAIYDRQLARHAGQPPPPLDRRILEAYLMMTLVAVWLGAFFVGRGWGTWIFHAPPATLTAASLALLSLGAALFVRLARRKVVSGPQLLYLARLLCYPVALVHRPAIALAGLAAAHGLEYFAITGRLVRRRQVDEQGALSRLLGRAPAVAAAMALFLLPGSVMALASPRFPSPALAASLLGGDRLLESLSVPIIGAWLGLTLAHFYLDGRLFRFRHPAVREAVLPYLDGRR